MNVKKLIEKYKRYEGKWNGKTGELARQIFLEDLKQLDEPQPIKIPQCVADAREKRPEIEDALHYTWGNGTKEFTEWYNKKSNRDLFARAWLDGYEVEKEKRYLVKFKGFNSSYIILKHRHYGNTWFLGGEQEYEFYRLHHTRKQLEEAGFGWVFDCPGIEIEEVE